MSLAPVLNGDTAPGGGPVRITAGPGGAWYPIILVHGWTSKDTVASPTDRSGVFSHRIDLSSLPPYTASTTRSLIGQLQGLPGAAVFTFDYRDYSGSWVDDSHLGPALGKVIDCLYQASRQKVILVGHSMGGLVSRWAATHPGVTGSDRSGEISTVVTFGTPENGSVAALLLAAGLSVSTNDVVAVLRLVLSACGALASNQIETGTICDTLPPQVRTFASAAGVGLRAGSSQLAALPPWPHGIAVDALAGDTSFEVPSAGWFALPWQTTKLSGAGDLVVTTDSALAGATTSTRSNCDYELNAFRAATDAIGLTIGPDLVSLRLFTGACFHTNLMRNITLTNEALGAIHDDLASRAALPVTDADLLNAPVPALRGNPAGRLHSGILTHAGGESQLVRTGGGAPAHGDFTGDGVQDAAAVIGATSGVGGEDEYVELYTNKDHLLGGFDPVSVDPNGYHAQVLAMVVRDESVLLDWVVYPDGASTTTPTYWSGRLRWNGHAVVLSDLAPHTGITNSGLWTDPHVTITPGSLGAVRLGMTIDQAQAASGQVFDGAGDGYRYPNQVITGYDHLYVGGSPVLCVGAEGNGTSAAQRVTTIAGVGLGDPAAAVTQAYGSAATFVPQPTSGGIDPRAGYVVQTAAGRIVFAIDHPGGTIIGIAAGGPSLTPSGCTG